MKTNIKKSQKYCHFCKTIKNVKEFHQNNSNKDGISDYCKKCKALQEKARWLRIKNDPKVILQRKTAKRKWDLKNKQYKRNYQRKYCKERYKKDIKFKLVKNLRNRINLALKNNWKSGSTIELLGCSIQFFKKYIEKQFLPGMTWDNHSKTGWHIDHVIACDKFDLSNPKQQKICFHYTNLQPLWSEDNLKKHTS